MGRWLVTEDLTVDKVIRAALSEEVPFAWSQLMKSGRRGISGRGSSTDKGFEMGTGRPGWLGSSNQVGK